MDSIGGSAPGARIVVPERGGAPPQARRVEANPALATRAVWWLLGGLLVVSTMDLVSLWWPVSLGSLNWEFATVGATADALPLPTISLFSMLAVAALTGRRRVGVVLALTMAGVGVLCLLLLGVHLLNLPLIAKAVEPGPGQEVVYEAAWKAILTLLVYIVVYSMGSRFSWRLFRSGTPNPEQAT